MRTRGLAHRAVLVALAAVVAIGSVACSSPPEEVTINDTDIEAMAAEIHAAAITIDTHDDIPGNFATAEVDPGVRGDRKVDLPKMREGGLDVAFFVVYAGQIERDEAGYASMKAEGFRKFEAIHRLTEQMHPDQIELATSPEDVERIVGSGKLAAAIGVENGGMIGKDLSLIEQFRDLGAGYFSLTHNGHNDIADSCNPSERLGDAEEEHGGVSEFGAQVIAELNRVGIMLDVSHASKKSMMDAVRLSQAPIIASHSSCRALCDTSRNLDDEQLLALRDNGGVAQMVALGSFVEIDSERDAAVDALREELGLPSMREMYTRMATATDDEIVQMREQWDAFQAQVAEVIDPVHPPTDVADFVDHIDHAVGLIGINHVGISSDFDGGGGIVGFNDASEAMNVTLELVRRGYTAEEIEMLWGGNLLRVWREVREVAERIQGEAS